MSSRWETADDRLVREYLRAVARAENERADPLPSADTIWDRARLMRGIERRRELVREAVRPAARVERGVGIGAAGALGGWTWWRWDLVVAEVGDLARSAATADPWMLLGVAGVLATLVGIGAGWASDALRRA